MSEYEINYDQLMQEAHRELIHKVLLRVVQTGLPGEHHFFIIFNTGHPGVRLSDRLRAQYPEEMTIVLQHQYRHLRVHDDCFEIELSFSGIPELLTVPYTAITGFVDPSVPFGLQLAGDPSAGLENSIGMLVPGLPLGAVDDSEERNGPRLRAEREEAGVEFSAEPAATQNTGTTNVENIFSPQQYRSAEDQPIGPASPAEKSGIAEVPPPPPFAVASEEENLYDAQFEEAPMEEEEEQSADIVSLDAFRKKST